MNNIDKLKELINKSNNIVVLTGAGVSTLSGIPDFRSNDGLYNQNNKYDYPPEYLLSSNCFYNHTDIFYDYYKNNMNLLKYEPNIIHKYLKKLEDQHKLLGIITQNIDGLHTKAGNKLVYEIHGSIYNNYCLKCNKYYDANYLFKDNKIPKCSCGGIIKPDVVLYGEALPDSFNYAIKLVEKADLFLILGTSLSVFPASNLVNFFNGDNLVIVTKSKTIYDNKANLVINDDLEEVFNNL